MPETTWVLDPTSFAATIARTEKINARAVRRGFTGRIEVTGTERTVSETGPGGETRTYIVIDTLISGEAPRYGGREFLAAIDTIDTTDGEDFILRTAPGVDAAAVDRSTLTAGYCDHCKAIRTNRIYTFLVRNVETGEVKQVGKTCLRDFTGHQGRPVFIDLDSVIDDVTDFLGSFPHSPLEYAPETIVAVAWAASRAYGWKPGSHGGYTTAMAVNDYLFGTTKVAKKVRDDLSPEMPAATAKAKEIIPALLSGLETTSDYTINLTTALRGVCVGSRHFGIVVSAVVAYERMIGDQVRQAAEVKKKAESAYAGTVGDKLTITGTITRARAVDSSFGYHESTSMLFIIEAGTTVLKTVTKAAWAFDVDQGDTVTITATVKSHEDYHGTRQTVVTRPKLIDRTKADAE